MTPGNPTDVMVKVKDLWQLTGLRPHPAEKRLLSEWTGIPSDRAPERYLVLVEWDARLTYLQVAVSASGVTTDVGRPGNSTPFSSDPSAAVALFTRYGWPENRMPESVRASDLDQPTMRFLIAEVPTTGRSARGPTTETALALILTVDTDDQEFRRYGNWKTPLGGAAFDPAPILTITSYFPQNSTGRPVKTEGHRRVLLQLSPATMMEEYTGYLALDLGNTNSGLAFMAPGDPDAEKVMMVGGAGVTPTAVRIRSVGVVPPPVKPAPGKPAGGPLIPTAEYEIGYDAMVGGSGTLVLGAKRLLAAPDTAPDPGYTVSVGSREQAIPRQLPAELFITGMLRKFHAEKQKRITRLAVTCPTTFTDREIAQLTEVVFRAAIRAMRFDKYPPPAIAQKLKDSIIPLVIDEASAAAFFFLYRDFIRAVGGTRGVRYMYPKGVNLLLYDCGGGTTDLALVHLRPASKEDLDKAERGGDTAAFTHLHIDVLGRTGMRGFGGDNITQATFRLIKAKLAAGSGDPPAPRVPDDPALLKSFLDDPDTQERIDAVIPTRFRDPNNPTRKRPELRRDQIEGREANHLELWQWAEAVKIALSVPGTSETTVAPVQEQEGRQSLLHVLATAWGSDHDDAFVRAASVKIRRDELDELVRDSVKESVDKANRLITDRLKGGEIHRVYVVGNAARYPLIREMIEQDLQARFLTPGEGIDHRLVLDSGNLKHAVAKGAVIALRLLGEMEGFDVSYDRELIRRLPHHIGYLNMSREVKPQPVYREHERYQDLKPIPIPVPKAIPGQKRIGAGFALSRQWPGEDTWERYIRFQFDQPVDGPLQLKHEPNPPRFVLRDEGKSKQEAVGVEEALAEYVSPAQQGLY